MTIKSQILTDNAIFLDTDAFADTHTVKLEGITYTIPVIVEDEASEKYDQQYGGVYQTVMTIFFSESAVPRAPVKGELLLLDNVTYLVAKCNTDLGMLEIKLSEPDV